MKGRDVIAWQAWLAAAWLALSLAGCSLPPLEGRTSSTYFTDTADTVLGREVMPAVVQHPGKNGLYSLPLGRDALAARIIMADKAERSIDAQYYIWHGDTTGTLMFESLWKAADRGVRVRLLLDDNPTKGLDPFLSGMDAHPNIEVRLFNPKAIRSVRWLNFVTDFTRVNRRMHNKSFTVDNQVTVIGGRNVGDEYFAARDDLAFSDLDVIAAGPVVSEISHSFDLYWNSAAAYPVQTLLGPPSSEAVASLKEKFAAVHDDEKNDRYLESVQQTPLAQKVRSNQMEMEWAEVRLLVDDPAKILERHPPMDAFLLPELLESVFGPHTELDLVSAYFVPMEDGAAELQSLAQRGVKVRILTNALESTDVPPVHAGYAKRRKGLLKAGVDLYELKRGMAAMPYDGKTGMGTSSASLHAKTFQVDQQRIFIGSFNFDPRSAMLNTELGLIVDSPGMAHRLKVFLDQNLPTYAYHLQLSENGALQWQVMTPEGLRVLDVEPGAGPLTRFMIGILSFLPIEWLL